MGRRRQKLSEGDFATCDTCLNGEWSTESWNISLQDGKPLTKRCIHYYAAKIGELRGTKACEHYITN